MQKVIGRKKTLQVLLIFPKNLLSDKNLANEIVHSKCVPSNASLYHITFSFFIQITFFRTKVFSTFVKSYWKRFFRLKMKWNLHKGREKITCPIICIYIYCTNCTNVRCACLKWNIICIMIYAISSSYFQTWYNKMNTQIGLINLHTYLFHN